MAVMTFRMTDFVADVWEKLDKKILVYEISNGWGISILIFWKNRTPIKAESACNQTKVIGIQTSERCPIWRQGVG